MSANLEVNEDGTYNAAYVGDAPWWETGGLGKRLPIDVSPNQMLEAANLDWDVEKQPLYVFDRDGSYKEAKGKQALVRASDGKLLDFVGEDWNPLQNSDAFEFFNEFVEVGKMTMESKPGQGTTAFIEVPV